MFTERVFTPTKKKLIPATDPIWCLALKRTFINIRQNKLSHSHQACTQNSFRYENVISFSLSHFFLSLSLSNIYTLLKISPISDSLDPHHYIWTQWTITTPIPHPQTLYTLSNSLHSTPLTCSQNSTPCPTPSPAHYPSSPPLTFYPTSDPALSRARIARADSGVSTMRKLSSTLFLQYL